MTACPSRRREIFELVDGALTVGEQETLHAHLVDCPGCRAELASLRRVRDRLRTSDGQPHAPEALTSRLIDIAGEDAGRPLYARPFDRVGGGPLPSRRRARRTLARALVVTCVLLSGLVGVGWAAAPPARTPAIDPGPIVRDEFAAALCDMPLANPAVSAVRAGGHQAGKTRRLLGPPPPAEGELHTDGGLDALERAARASGGMAYAGTQVVQVRHLAGYWVTRADVEVRPGQGTVVRLPGHGSSADAVVVPQPPTDLELLARHYQIRYGAGPEVADHPTVVVEALADGRPQARWWLQADSGVVVWQQTLAADGSVVMNAGFLRLDIGQVEAPRHLPPMLTSNRDMTALAVAAGPTMQGQGWQSGQRLAGLDLLALRGDGTDPMVHSVYGDGVTTLSVLQQKGGLAGPPPGFVWDPEIRAYRSLDITTTYTWQSSDTVFTVATDGPAGVAERAVAELPHDRPVLRTRAERVLDGWRALTGLGR